MQRQNSIIVFLVFIFSLGLFNSCEKFTFKDDILPSTYIVKFSSDIVPIFSKRGCAASSCHGGAQAPNLKVNPYQSLIKNGDIDLNTPSQSTLYQYITPTGKMYKITTVSSWDRQLILQWIVQGAKNN